jgi:hypothetical protein
VSPRFLRNVIESMVGASAVAKVRSMTITGSLPLDATPLSVRHPDVRAWLDDPTAYLGAWSDPGFPVQRVTSPRGMTLRVRLEGDLTDEHYFALVALLTSWYGAVQLYADIAGTRLGAMQPDAHFGRTRREFRAGKLFFNHTYGPTRDVLVNLLSRFHRTQAPIAEVDIGMS